MMKTKRKYLDGCKPWTPSPEQEKELMGMIKRERDREFYE